MAKKKLLTGVYQVRSAESIESGPWKEQYVKSDRGVNMVYFGNTEQLDMAKMSVFGW